jgi:3-hydroxyacyl-CoA dehydrogenase/enoyl-CoA hydratase/3-hydroxybutyryl-CoA epimerase
MEEKYGERFKVPELLKDMAAKGEGFYDRFPPGGVKAKAAA